MRKYNVGEFVKLKNAAKQYPEPHGVITHIDNSFYYVKWFDSYQEDGGYMWASLEKI